MASVPRPSTEAARMNERGLLLRRIAAIYVGGVLGALARVGLAEAAPHGPGGWPWATFAANMAGGLLLGFFLARVHEHPGDSLAHPLLTTGICDKIGSASCREVVRGTTTDDR